MAGYSGTALVRKLGIKEGCRLFLLHAPKHYPALVAPLPAGVQLVGRIGRTTDLVHIFSTSRKDLERSLRAAPPTLLIVTRPAIRRSALALTIGQECRRRFVPHRPSSSCR